MSDKKIKKAKKIRIKDSRRNREKTVGLMQRIIKGAKGEN
jgi:hypothetical protein